MFLICPMFTGEEPFAVNSLTEALTFSDKGEYYAIDLETRMIVERGYERPLDVHVALVI